MSRPSLLHSEVAWQRFIDRMSARTDSRELLSREADTWLAAIPPSITTKTRPAPSGDPHDYISLAPYSWPDPAKADGLPWIHRDGEVNPEFYAYDNPTLEAFCHGTIRLVLQAVAADSPAHARQAGRFLRAWFIDAGTRMNPHLRYAQLTPGVCEGRAAGIIDTTSMVFVLDAATRLPFNEDWTPAHLKEAKTWISSYLDWLLDSRPGREESAAGNNHGSWLDAQVTTFAVFCDRPDVARRQLETITLPRLAKHFTADGSQPHELRRTLSFTYCTYNLLAFACAACIGEGLGIHLWTAEGGLLQKGVQWMLPYYEDTRPWTHQQLKAFDCTSAALLLSLAQPNIDDPALPTVLARIETHPWQSMTFSKASLTGRKPPEAGIAHNP